MSELVFNTVFKEVSCMFKGEAFSAMYFGSHCGKNILILQHDITVMIVFEDDLQRSVPEFIQTVSFRGERRRGIQIVGNGNFILLLDVDGRLWRLVNAFEVSSENTECFHSLKEGCFYEWVPFKKFNFVKVMALSGMENGFACLGLCADFRRKLIVMSSLDSDLEDYTFDELNRSTSNLGSYFLTSVDMNIKDSVFAMTLVSNAEETLLVTDRFSGKTYLCGKNSANVLINVSNNYLISAFHLQEEKCLVLCFENGKLVFCFYNGSLRQCGGYLSKRVIFIEKCCSPDCCLLWSDGASLYYTRLTSYDNEDVKLSHLKLNCVIQSPLSLVRIKQQFLTVTVNNVYYYISIGMRNAEKITKLPKELLLEICNGSSLTQKLEEKTDVLAHYLQCKDVTQKYKTKGNIEMKWEGDCLLIKNHLEITLREKFWKIHLMMSDFHRKFVHIVNLETDLSKGGLLMIENPFKSRCHVKVCLVGDFDGRDLFLDLGEVSELEGNHERDQLGKEIQDILKKRNEHYNNGWKKRME